MSEKVDFGANRKQAEDAGLLGGGDIYKYKDGDNRFRLLSKCLAHAGEFKGEKNFKWLCYILDRRDGKVKPHFMPHTIYKAIEALQTSEDYPFYEVPMPYDLTVRAEGAGTKEVKYSVIPARKEVPLTADEDREWHKAKPLEELQQAFKDKAKQRGSGTQAHDDAPHPAVTEDELDGAVPF